jgi:hypothetical protein
MRLSFNLRQAIMAYSQYCNQLVQLAKCSPRARIGRKVSRTQLLHDGTEDFQWGTQNIGVCCQLVCLPLRRALLSSMAAATGGARCVKHALKTACCE